MQLLSILGMFLVLVGYVWFLAAAFKESIVWGLLCLFLPIAQLVFLILHFKRAFPPIALQFVGFAIAAVGFFAFGDSLGRMSAQ